MRHVSRTHRGNLYWLCERISVSSNISVKYVHTNQQIASIFKLKVHSHVMSAMHQ